jgi:hypothetical protein
MNLKTAVENSLAAARGCFRVTLICSASDQNGEVLNVYNPPWFEAVGHSGRTLTAAFRMNF